jgi:hypothetical protein
MWLKCRSSAPFIAVYYSSYSAVLQVRPHVSHVPVSTPAAGGGAPVGVLVCIQVPPMRPEAPVKTAHLNLRSIVIGR